jgi:hypothetical protein
MNFFFLDASALCKRYAPEIGSDRMHYLFQHAPVGRLSCLMLGASEVYSVLVRRQNAGGLTPAAFRASITNLFQEIIASLHFPVLRVENSLIRNSLSHIDQHAINSNDAAVLQMALRLAAGHRQQGNDLVLVASDQRLLRAAQREGLTTFDPETQDSVTLQTLLATP